MAGRSRPLRRLGRALLVLATSTLVVCGVKGPPRPPAPAEEGPLLDAGQADAGQAAAAGPLPVPAR